MLFIMTAHACFVIFFPRDLGLALAVALWSGWGFVPTGILIWGWIDRKDKRPFWQVPVNALILGLSGISIIMVLAGLGALVWIKLRLDWLVELLPVIFAIINLGGVLVFFSSEIMTTRPLSRRLLFLLAGAGILFSAALCFIVYDNSGY
jgi:hypothetical protein